MRNIEVANVWQIIFYRSLFFSVSILTIIAFQNRSSVYKSIKNVGYPGILGAVFYTFANIMFVHAFANTTVANALFTLSSIPFITAALAFFFLDENISKRTISIMFLALLGIIIMISEGLALGQIYGNVMALVTAVSFSCFTIIIRKYRAVDMLPTILIGGIIILSVTFFISLGNLRIPLNEIFLCFLWGGVLSGCVNYIFIYATRFLYASAVTFFMLFEFALGPFWVWIFLNETISRNTFYGGILVMVSVFIYSTIEVLISRKKIQKGRINLN